jgi:hypothetical protein
MYSIQSRVFSSTASVSRMMSKTKQMGAPRWKSNQQLCRPIIGVLRIQPRNQLIPVASLQRRASNEKEKKKRKTDWPDARPRWKPFDDASSCDPSIESIELAPVWPVTSYLWLASQNAPQLSSTQDGQIVEWHKWRSGFTYLEKENTQY